MGEAHLNPLADLVSQVFLFSQTVKFAGFVCPFSLARYHLGYLFHLTPEIPPSRAIAVLIFNFNRFSG